MPKRRHKTLVGFKPPEGMGPADGGLDSTRQATEPAGEEALGFDDEPTRLSEPPSDASIDGQPQPVMQAQSQAPSPFDSARPSRPSAPSSGDESISGLLQPNEVHPSDPSDLSGLKDLAGLEDAEGDAASLSAISNLADLGTTLSDMPGPPTSNRWVAWACAAGLLLVAGAYFAVNIEPEQRTVVIQLRPNDAEGAPLEASAGALVGTTAAAAVEDAPPSPDVPGEPTSDVVQEPADEQAAEAAAELADGTTMVFTEEGASDPAPDAEQETPPAQEAAPVVAVAPVQTSSTGVTIPKSKKLRLLKAKRLLKRAKRLRRFGHAARAQVSYEQAIEVYPSYGAAVVGLVTLHLRAKATEPALHWARRLEQLRPKGAMTYLLLGDALNLQGDRAGARDAWKRARRYRSKSARRRLKVFKAKPANPDPD